MFVWHMNEFRCKRGPASNAQSKAEEKAGGGASGQGMWFWFQFEQLWLALGSQHLWWTDPLLIRTEVYQLQKLVNLSSEKLTGHTGEGHKSAPADHLKKGN